MFINQKLYGKATEDDPVNNIDLVRKMRAGGEDSTYQRQTSVSRLAEGDNPRTIKRGKRQDETLEDLNRKTAFRTNLKSTATEKKIEQFLENWHGTT